jgi:hypothetical protein
MHKLPIKPALPRHERHVQVFPFCTGVAKDSPSRSVERIHTLQPADHMACMVLCSIIRQLNCFVNPDSRSVISCSMLLLFFAWHTDTSLDMSANALATVPKSTAASARLAIGVPLFLGICSFVAILRTLRRYGAEVTQNADIPLERIRSGSQPLSSTECPPSSHQT